MGAPSKACGEHIDARLRRGGWNGRAHARQAASVGSRGVGVAHIKVICDGLEHRDAQAGAEEGERGAHTRQTASVGSRGVGVAHLDVSSDGREHRDAQAGEGGVHHNLRGGIAGADGRAGHVGDT
eukprot:scaffold1332_cov49-Isochrysis_galbana.AAC.1